MQKKKRNVTYVFQRVCNYLRMFVNQISSQTAQCLRACELKRGFKARSGSQAQQRHHSITP